MFQGLKIDFNQNLCMCDRCTKSVRAYLYVIAKTSWTFVSSSSIGSDVPGANVWNAVRLKEAAGHRSERVLTQVAANQASLATVQPGPAIVTTLSRGHVTVTHCDHIPHSHNHHQPPQQLTLTSIGHWYPMYATTGFIISPT